MSFTEELKIIRRVIDKLQKETPHFEFRMILTGLKIVGHSHVATILKHIAEGTNQEDKRLASLIAGFDLVNEEDFTPDISEFAQSIITA